MKKLGSKVLKVEVVKGSPVSFIEEFAKGKTPSDLLKEHPTKINSIYKYHRVFLLLEIKRQIDVMLMRGKIGLSQKECERILKALKTGELG